MSNPKKDSHKYNDEERKAIHRSDAEWEALGTRKSDEDPPPPGPDFTCGVACTKPGCTGICQIPAYEHIPLRHVCTKGHRFT